MKTQPKSTWEVILRLDEIIDESDPDNDLPQSVHSYQTAIALRNFMKNDHQLKRIPIKSLFGSEEWTQIPEKIRVGLYAGKTVPDLYPEIQEWGWLPLIGFIHDLGKVLEFKEYGDLPQWTTVGDTFPVGCEF